MKKILVLLFLVLLTTGCQASYDIEIGDYNIKEKITINVPNNLDSNSKATIIDFIESEAYPLLGEQKDDIFYDIFLEDIQGGQQYTLNYTYKNNEIKNSKVLNQCFQNAYVDETNDYYMFSLTGKFYCLNKNKKIDITVKTANEMHDHNATEHNLMNTYKWEISEENKDDVDIKFVVIKNNTQHKEIKKATSLFVNLLFTLGLSLIVLGGIYIGIKLMKFSDDYIK